MERAQETLELVERMGRPRYRLGEHTLTGGDVIALFFSGGWVTGRFDWSGERQDPPRFYYSITLRGEGRVHEDSLAIPEGALVRLHAR